MAGASDPLATGAPPDSADASGADALRLVYDAGFAAAQRGEEAAPACATTPAGRAFLRGYVDGAAARGGA